MSWGLLDAAMLAGLAGVALPILVHLLNQRRAETVAWGAMRFLLPDLKTRRRARLSEWLLMLIRACLLAAIALAAARPYQAAPSPSVEPTRERRDVVFIIDGSSGMSRRLSPDPGDTPRARAIAWTRRFLDKLGPGDSVALLSAKEGRVAPLVSPPSLDRERVANALSSIRASRGSSDLVTSIVEAFKLLERPGNPVREVVLLGDGRRAPWRLDNATRLSLLRDLRARVPGPPTIRSVAFGSEEAKSRPNASVASVSIRDGDEALAPGLPVEIVATLLNSGPGPLTCSAELVVDGVAVPGSTKSSGPIPPAGRTEVYFKYVGDVPGEHLLTVRLTGHDDPLAIDDEASLPVKVEPALPVLLVDGETSREPLGSETDFPRIALAPSGDEARVFETSVIPSRDLESRHISGRRAVLLANVDRVSPAVAASLTAFVESGGGLVIALGDRSVGDDLAESLAGLGFPAAIEIGEWRGEPSERTTVVARPAPASFLGKGLASLGRGDSPAIAEADFFAYRRLKPSATAEVLGRFDTGDPWIVERRLGDGRIILLAAPLDAESGTLPVNPDYVPLVHKLIRRAASGRETKRVVRPGNPIQFTWSPPPPETVRELSLRLPDDSVVSLPVARAGDSGRVGLARAIDPGVYRLDLPNPPGGAAYATVLADPSEFDLTPLSPEDARLLSRDDLVKLVDKPDEFLDRLFSEPTPMSRREYWRPLIWSAIGLLALELFVTRRLSRSSSAAPTLSR